MFNRLFLCVTQQHDEWLLLMAIAVCLTAAATALHMMRTGAAMEAPRGDLWLFAAGVTGGAGVWATHFIAMLAYDPGLSTGYGEMGTALSLLIALAFVSLGVFAAARLTGFWSLAAGGLLLAVGMGAMHYTGVMALRAPGLLSWRPDYVATSLVAGLGLSMLSLRLLASPHRLRALVLSSLALVAAVCSVHFIGMAGLVITPDPRIVFSQGLDRDFIAILVGGLTALILFAALAVVWVSGRAQATSLRLLRTVFDAVPHGLAYFDADDRLVFGNESYHREKAAFGLNTRTGRTYAEILDEALAQGALPEAVGREAEWLADVLTKRRAPSSVREQRTRDGRILHIYNNHTTDGGMVTSSTDITELKGQAAQLMQARDAAQAAAQAKSDFLANMSHELRTPMNGIVGVAELLAAEPLTPQQAEFVSIIRSSGATLDRLLADLLDVSKMDAGALEIAAAPFDLAHMAQSVFALLTPMGSKKGLTLRCAVAPEAEGLFVGDEPRIRQILTNLVSNAIKFTTKGSVTLSVSVPDGEVKMVVADTGIGFDPNDKERLFSRFVQADESITRRFGGTGLGLSISRDLAERMGGSITPDSGPGGSTFVLSLPLARAATLGGPKPNPAEATDEPGAARILVVDDNATNQRVLALILDSAGIETTVAANGREAVDLWRDGAFDAVLMDIQMPVMDGLTAVKTIRALEAETGHAKTPILMVSASALPDHVSASLAAGANGHLAKPVTADRLFAALGGLGDEPQGVQAA